MLAADANGAGITYFHANSTLADSTASGLNSVAIGPAATATNAGDVALGFGSVTGAVVATSGVTLRGVAYYYAGITPASTVSIGAPGAERTLTNVAAGQVNATSTDAVNGSELFATDQAVNSLVALAGGVFVSNNSGGAGAPIATGANSVAGGFGANDNGVAASTVLGVNAQVNAGVTGSNVALGYNSTVGASAVGSSTATVGAVTYAGFAGSVPAGTVSIGAAGQERTLGNLAAGQITATSTDAVNGSQLYAVASTSQSGVASLSTGISTGLSTVSSNVATLSADASGAGITYFRTNSSLADATATGANAVAIGPATVASGAGSVVIGNGAADNGAQASVVIGQGASIASGVGGSNVALGAGAVVTTTAVGTSGVTLAGVVYAGFAGTSPIGVVSVGSEAGPRVVTGVAAGAITATSLDAINGSELYSVSNQVSQTANTVAGALGGGSTGTAAGVSNPTYLVYGNTATTVAQAVAVLQQASPIQYATTATIGGTPTTTAVLTPTNTVALVGSTASAAVTLTNVANGVAPNDAVNVSQLQSVEVHYMSVGVAATTTAAGITPNVVAPVMSNYNGDGATGAYAVAISPNAAAMATGDVALGFGATAMGTTAGAAVSVGMENTASGAGAVALGDPNISMGDGAVTVGANNTALGDGSVAVGNISSAVGSGSVALGNDAVANNAGDVALGSGSVSAAANPTASVTVRGVTYAVAGANPTSVVSVGAPGAERQITNVAAGQITATSTDAVNGSELYATNEAMNAQTSSTNAAVVALSSGISKGLLGLVQQQGGAPGNGAITVGAQTGGTSVNIAGTSGARVLSGVAAGVASTDAVDLGQLQSVVGGATANAVQYDSASHLVVTLGGPGSTVPVALDNVAAGAVTATSAAAVNGSQLYETNANVTNLQNGAAGPFQVYQSGTVTAPVAGGPQSTAGGDGAVASSGAATAIGYYAAAGAVDSLAVGAQAQVASNATGSVAIGNGAQVTAANAVALGAGSLANQPNTVSVGTETNPRRITNVAAGIYPTDAVNVGQLQPIYGNLSRLTGGVALGLATGSVDLSLQPGEKGVSAGVGTFEGRQAYSFKWEGRPTANFVYGISVGFTDNYTVGASAGVGFKF